MVMSMHMFGWKPMNHDGNGKVLKRNYCRSYIYFIKDFCSYFQKLVYGLKDFRKYERKYLVMI